MSELDGYLEMLRDFGGEFGITDDIIDYLAAFLRLGRPSEVGIPKDILKIGGRLIAKGLLNGQMIPPNLDWVWPYWITKQFDPTSTSFVPRAHLLQAMNITHRNWTAVGLPDEPNEAIVDPRGLVTPWYDGFSVDCWAFYQGELILPAESLEVNHYYEDGHIPILHTSITFSEITMDSEVFAATVSDDPVIFQEVSVRNDSEEIKEFSVYLALRPYNPEGLSLIKTLEYDAENGSIAVNGDIGMILAQEPDGIALGKYSDGDVASQLPRLNNRHRITCPNGFATGVVEYRLTLHPTETQAMHVRYPLQRGSIIEERLQALREARHEKRKKRMVKYWSELVDSGMTVTLPDKWVEDSFYLNKAYLLTFYDGESITPGPFTYHQFWMRDAAYMVNVLDKVGLQAQAHRIIGTFPDMVEEDGCVSIPEGEWDSNGQMVFTLMDHYRFIKDRDYLERIYPVVKRAAEWIDTKRQSTVDDDAPHAGLLPPSMSAEHLGPNDYFYWDDLWGLKGLEDAAEAAAELEKRDDHEALLAKAKGLRAAIERSLEAVDERLGERLLPSSPYRRPDSAMIGSICALYPLRLYPTDDERIMNTIEWLMEHSWFEDAFFHNIAHSGCGTYLTMQVAHALAWNKDRRAVDIFNWVLENATPTFTWPEAIHPQTKGGCMGDGHHGWAAADYLSLLRDLLFFEDGETLVITPTMPTSWLQGDIEVAHAPSYFGEVNFTIRSTVYTNTLTLELDCTFSREPASIVWCLPRGITRAVVDGEEVDVVERNKIVVEPSTHTVEVHL